MALNLWTLAGKASYNPLPTTGFGSIFSGNLPFIGNAIMTFYAYSASSAKIDVWVQNDSHTNGNFNLTPVRTKYTVNLTTKIVNGVVYIADDQSKGDIVIDSITLVQAPLPQLTINGVDGFLSGKWVLNGKGTVIDDITAIVNPTVQYDSMSSPKLYLTPNTTYSISASQVNGNGAFLGVNFYDVNGTYISNANQGSNVLSGTFTTPSNINYAYVALGTRAASGFNTCTFKNIMLNLGSIVAPYSKKTGDVMKLPTPTTSNLCPDFSTWTFTGSAGFLGNPSVNGSLTFQAWNDAATSPYIPVKNTNSIRVTHDAFGSTAAPVNSANPDGTKAVRLMNVMYYDAKFNLINNTSGYTQNGNAQAFLANSWQSTTYVVFTGPQVAYIRVSIQSSSVWTAPSFSVRNIIVTPDTGSVVPYVPFAVQMNKVPQKWVPKKNMLDFSGSIVSSLSGEAFTKTNTDITVVVPTGKYGVTLGKSISLNPNTNYTISGLITVLSGSMQTTGWRLQYEDNSLSAVYTSNYTFNSGSHTSVKILLYGGLPASSDITVKFSKLQLEQGQTATPFEPYTPVLPPVNMGLRFNGNLGNYINSPNASLNQNLHLTVDFSTNVIPSSNAMIVDQFNPTYGISVFINSSGYICYRFGSSGAYNSTINVCDGMKHRAEIIVVNGTVSWFLDGGQLGGSVGGYSGGSLNVPIAIGQRTNGNLYPFTGTIYKVSMSGDANFSYDFTNPSTIFGNTVISGRIKNILPNFEDPRWIINTDGKVLGKDYLHHDISGSYRPSLIKIPVLPNTNYLLLFGGVSGTNLSGGNTFWKMFEYDANHTQMASYGSSNALFYRITTSSSTVMLEFDIGSELMPSGKIDIYKPTIIQSDLMEGTIYGSPTLQLKQSKRTLYNLR